MGSKWLTKEELETIKRLYATTTAAEIGRMIGRPASTIHQVAYKRGWKGGFGPTRSKGYTELEDELLRQHYGKVSNKRLAEALGRTVNGIGDRATKLGLAHYRHWTPEEDEIMRKHYGKVRRIELLRMLPGRKETAIQRRAQHLKVTRAYKRRTAPAEQGQHDGREEQN